MNQRKTDEIVERHQHWLKKDCCGWESMKADLRGADLQGTDLRWADLRETDLRETDLRKADLQGANLQNLNIDKMTKLFIPIACPRHGRIYWLEKSKK